MVDGDTGFGSLEIDEKISVTVWKTILDSLNCEFQEVYTDYWQNILKEKESVWISIVYIFFPEMMQCIQNKEQGG